MEHQNVAPAPGKGEAPAPGKPVEGAPAAGDGGPPPEGGGPFGGGIGMMLLMFLPMILIIFFLNRSQSKKQKELESKLKKGDRVITSGGIIGRIAEISTNSKYMKLEVSSGVKLEVLKTAIQGLDTGDVAAVSAKGAEKGSEKSSETSSGDASDKDDKKKK